MKTVLCLVLLSVAGTAPLPCMGVARADEPAACRPAARFVTAPWWTRRLAETRGRILKDKGACYDLVLVGDSITHRWENRENGAAVYPALLGKYKVLNLGSGGDGTQNVIWRFENNGELDDYTAKVFAVMIGVNNGASDPEGLVRGVEKIVGMIRAKHPESKIVLQAILPHGKNPRAHVHWTKVNPMLRAYAEKNGFAWLDMGARFLGQLPGMDNNRQVVAQDGFVYVVSRETGMRIIDARDPKNMRLRSRYDSVEFATGIDVVGKTAFLSERIYGVEVVDVSDPDNPAHVCIRKTGESQSNRYRDGYLYSGEWGGGAVEVFDARDLKTFRPIGHLRLGGFGDGLEIDGDVLYCSTGHDAKHHRAKAVKDRHGAGRGLDIFSLADPAQPKWISRVDFPVFTPRNEDFWTPRVACGLAFCCDSHNGLFVVDVKDPARPTVVDRFCVPQGGEGVAVGCDQFLRNWRGVRLRDVVSGRAVGPAGRGREAAGAAEGDAARPPRFPRALSDGHGGVPRVPSGGSRPGAHGRGARRHRLRGVRRRGPPCRAAVGQGLREARRAAGRAARHGLLLRRRPSRPRAWTVLRSMNWTGRRASAKSRGAPRPVDARRWRSGAGRPRTARWS